MIKFFRKIRYNLMEQNKTGKYLKYAIGEVILVMIGILLALQVNNWNEGRKLKVIEQNALQEVANGLLRLKEEVQINIEDENKGYEAAIHILSNFKEKSGYDKSLGEALNLVWNYTYMNESDDSYEFVKNSGLDLISNRKLRNKVAALYDVDLRATLGEAKVRGNYIEKLKLLMPKWYNSIDLGFYTRAPVEVWDYESLTENREFLFHVITQSNYSKHYIKELKGLEGAIDKVFNAINSEIERLN